MAKVKNRRSQYLPEDQDLLKELDSICASSGQVQSMRELEVSKIQIKATLRHRKTTSDYNKASRRFSIVLFAFAMFQLIIGWFQFTFTIITSQALLVGGIFLLVCAGLIWWVMRRLDSEVKDE